MTHANCIKFIQQGEVSRLVASNITGFIHGKIAYFLETKGRKLAFAGIGWVKNFSFPLSLGWWRDHFTDQTKDSKNKLQEWLKQVRGASENQAARWVKGTLRKCITIAEH